MALPRVSIVIPMLNEAKHVERFVEELAAQDYPGELEVIVADGGSTDGSRELLQAAADRVGLPVTLLENPKRTQSPGLNLCIRRATGELIIRLDCHTHYPPELVRRCFETSAATGAWNVGGTLHAVGETWFERAVACAYDSPFGGIGWTRHLGRKDPIDADVVYYGAFPREVFERIGLYDEELPIAELEDVCQRIRDAGGRVVFDPCIKLLYTPRGSLPALCKQYYRYGVWKVAVMRKHKRVLSGRSVVPFVFVLSLAALGGASTRSRSARRLLALELATYGTAAAAFGTAALRRRREPLDLLPGVVGSFLTCHLAHGFGQAHGWLRAARSRGRPWPPEPRLAPPAAAVQNRSSSLRK
jgi:glycosyltransferase involved in cell wall biosynthesis